MEAIIERSAPARLIAAVTKSDTVNFTNGVCRMLYVAGAGDVAVVPPEGSAVTLVGVLAGTTLLTQAIRVNSTGTSATGIVALY